jgi:predicted nucleic acid-binding protein
LSLVLDSSVTLSWCFEDERTAATVATLENVAANGAVAPSLWPLEVLNGLAMAERRNRLTAAQRETLSGFLASLPVTIDHETSAQAWTVTAHLAARHKLTLYDAAYLELAQRLNLPLASLDQELRAAGSAVGIKLLGQ